MKKITFYLIPLVFVLAACLISQRADASATVTIQKITDGRDLLTPQWSPDGLKVYAQAAGAGVVVVDIFSGAIVDISDDDGYARSFSVSPSGTKILFEFNELKNRNSNLWIMNSDGSNKVKIADNADSPSWAPDGQHFTYWQSGVVVADRELTALTKLTSSGGDPVFIDNEKIAYPSESLNIINISGQLIKTYPVNGPTKFSPFADRLYYEFGGIHSIDLTSGVVNELVPLEDAGEISSYRSDSFSVSPDGGKLVYNRFYDDGHEGPDRLTSDLWLIASDGSSKIKLTDTSDVGEFSPVWSPDGTKIVFVGDDVNHHHDLYIAIISNNP